MRRLQVGLVVVIVPGLTASLLFGRSRKGAKTSGSASAFVQNVIDSNKISFFSKSCCPFTNYGSQIQDVLLDLVGQRTIPQIFMKDKHIGGSDDLWFAISNGQLQKLLSTS